MVVRGLSDYYDTVDSNWGLSNWICHNKGKKDELVKKITACAGYSAILKIIVWTTCVIVIHLCGLFVCIKIHSLGPNSPRHSATKLPGEIPADILHSCPPQHGCSTPYPPFSFLVKLATSLASWLQKCQISICQHNSWRTMPSCSFMPQHMPAASSAQ